MEGSGQRLDYVLQIHMIYSVIHMVCSIIHIWSFTGPSYPGGGRLFDLKVVSSYVFCEPIMSRKNSKGKILNI